MGCFKRKTKRPSTNDERVPVGETSPNAYKSMHESRPPHSSSSSLTEQLLSLHETLKSIQDESQLSSRDEFVACRTVYRDLRRILETEKILEVDYLSSVNSNSNRIVYDFEDNAAKGGSKKDGENEIRKNERLSTWDSTPYIPKAFQNKFRALQEEVRMADVASLKVLKDHPAATRPLTIGQLRSNVKEFFVLDNSLRETTVGAPRGHTLEEKHKIVHSLAKTSLQEIILGAYGSKISVCSQIAEHWKSLGQSFDKTWGFSEIFDFEPIEEDKLWEAEMHNDDTNGFGNRSSILNKMTAEEEKTPEYYYTPEFIPKTTYDRDDAELLKKASLGFRKDAFKGALSRLLKKSTDPRGRIPMGLLMMAGYGIKNAILEVDTSVETFDYSKFCAVERIRFLMKWCRKNLAKRSGGEPTRILVNLRDFSNYYRSPGGLQNCLFLVDSLCRLPPEERPFGFMIEEPTGWLYPSEVGRTVRMIKLTMDRAGFPDAKFLIHCHWYFGMAEASQLQALCNGVNGVWAAVCKTGAQTGHACSTMTAVNLLRAEIDYPISEKYNLEEMCEAARQITEIVTRKPCDPHEEIYGSHAFDIPYFMVSLPSCRYSIHSVLIKIGVKERAVRLNTLSMVSSVYHAMVYYFGKPEETGWNPEYCRKMHDAINNHLLTGLSRDYNSPLGLGHLYGLVSREKLSWAMISIMSKDCKIPDTHPVVMDYIFRWNRLCRLYKTGKIEPHVAAQSKSMMFWGTPAVLEPELDSLPFEFYTADIMRNKVLEPIPNFFKLQVVNILTNDERKIQQQKIPEVHFYEMLLRLKLFLEEADCLNVLGLVDDFCIRKNHDFFFGEDALWLKAINKERPTVATNLLLKQMQFYHKHYINQGNTAISRCIESTAHRIDNNQSLPSDMQKVFRQKAAAALVHTIAEKKRQGAFPGDRPTGRFHHIKSSHESMLRALACDDGQDKDLAEELRKEICVETFTELPDNRGESASSSDEKLADEYVKYRRESLRVEEDDILSSSEILEFDVLSNGIEQNNSLRGIFGRRGSAKIIQAMRDQHVSFEEG